MDTAVPSAYADWIAPLAAPLAGDKPAGNDAKYELEHEEIREQVGRLEALSGQEVDWKRVAELARQLLSKVSKDLLVASYLARAEYEHDGLEGLARGLELLSTLMERYWEDMFPAVTRMRGRVSALSWLLTQCEQLLPDLAVDESHRQPLSHLEGVAKRFATVTRDKFAEHAPATRPLTDAVARLQLSLPAPPPQPESTGATPTAATPTTASTHEASGGAAPESGAPATPPAATTAPSAEPRTAVPAATVATPTQSTATVATPAPASPPPAMTPPPTAGFDPRAAAAPWLDAIPGANPAGEDSQYEPDHEAVYAEISKLEAVTDDPVDWKCVRELSDRLLKNASKHLSLATYFARASFELDGVPGLTVGLAMIAEMCDAFWEPMHPGLRRIRRRANAVTWLLEGVCERVAETTLNVGDDTMVAELGIAAERLAAVVRDRFDSEGPAVRPLLDTVTRLKLSVPQPEAPKPEPRSQPQPNAKPTAPAASAVAKPANMAMPDAPSGSVGSAEEAVAFLRKQGEAMLAAASVLRTASPANPTAYRLLRTGLFIHLEDPPPATAGKTQIPPLPAADKERLGLMASNGKWEALLEETESLCRRFRFDLNLHRLSARSLEQLGHAPAAAALAAELGNMLARMPDLPTYQAADGSPLADDATLDWLRTSVLAGPGDGPSPAGGGSPADDKTNEVVKAAQLLKKDGKLDDAIAALQAHIMQSAAGRDRFCARMALADFALASSHNKLGLGIYGALAREIADRNLDQWEPELAARCLTKLVKARRAHAKDAKAIAAEGDDQWLRLCELDPSLAQQLAPS